MTQGIRKLLMDMIPVIIGIFLGLQLNDWRSEQTESVFISSVMESISLELAENEAELRESIEKHNSDIDSLYFYAEDPDVKLMDVLNKIGGIQGVTIKNSSWKALMNTSITLADYKDVSLLVDIDENKSIMNLQASKLMDYAYEKIDSGEDTHKMMFGIILRDIQATEESLLEKHQAFLKRHPATGTRSK